MEEKALNYICKKNQSFKANGSLLSVFALKIFLEYQVNVPYQISLLYSGSKGMRPGWVINWCSCAEHFTFTVHLSTQEYK